MKVGIGITTMNRMGHILATIQGIKDTSNPDIICVSDDGSEDDTPSFVRAAHPDVLVLGNKNGGIARNKNRLLFRLFVIERCDVVLLMEDDVRPIEAGWLEEYSELADEAGHVNLRFSWMEGLEKGEGFTKDPYLSKHLTGQVMGISQYAFNDIGYFDHRFKSYGFEHVEYSRRMASMRYGNSGDLFYCLSDKWFRIDHDTPSTGTPEKIAESFEVLKLTTEDEGYKPPCDDWGVFLNECLTDEERSAIR